MKKIFAIVWKDAILRFSSPSELLFFIILPLVFTFLLAGGTRDDDPRVDLLVVDGSNTAISQQIIRELEASTAARPEIVTQEEAQNLFEGRRADVVLLIPAGIDMESLQSSSAAVELLQQHNNLNATVAERSAALAVRSPPRKTRSDNVKPSNPSFRRQRNRRISKAR
jgi:ABC-2 family transporter protein